MNKFVPVNEPLLNGNEKKYINECIDSGWISSEGHFVETFEKEFAKKFNRKYGIAVSNGSVALDLAMLVLGLDHGSEVIMPSFTIISCASAIIRAGLKPVLVDSDPDTWNMDVVQIEKKITSKTKAIMIVHIYGLPVDVDKILNLAQKYNLKIIEDTAEMIGQYYKDKPCGSFGDISTFSFYSNKHVTTGEGGMILTNNQNLAEKCRSFKNLCFKKERRFIHDELGFNYRLTNLQAALGLAQLENLEEHVNKKRYIGKFYMQNLKDIKYLQLPKEERSYAQNIYWVFGIILKDNYSHDADYVIKELEKLGVGCRPFFWPMHEQPVLKRMGLFKNEKYPVAENLARRGFYIPSGLAITDEQLNFVVKKVREFFNASI
ncbi:MAG: DegT/DnrJ/EryC1/StrS aminotransferase family [candidate division TM6 bacterium GW2011_GWF2_28_16]|nr:MAG: DegT/DnrJ/EryC1/StrS aminotransferase family [candidate division TM6 bacterium GW2011_GWF2_28_16]